MLIRSDNVASTQQATALVLSIASVTGTARCSARPGSLGMRQFCLYIRGAKVGMGILYCVSQFGPLTHAASKAIPAQNDTMHISFQEKSLA